jgi:hypothetical protein
MRFTHREIRNSNIETEFNGYPGIRLSGYQKASLQNDQLAMVN